MKKSQMHQATQNNEDIFRATILQELKNIKADTLVDIGSGDGKSTKPVDKILKSKKVICVDHDINCLKKAKKIGYEVVQADLNKKINLKTGIADFIIANQVIEHIAKTDILVSEIYRILKKDGQALICTPNLSSWHNIAALILGMQPFSSQVSDEKFIGNSLHPNYQQEIEEEQAHLRVFTPKAIKDICTIHGLEIVKFKGIGFYPFSGVLAQFFSIIDPLHAAQLFILVRKK